MITATPAPPASAAQALAELRALIASDGYAITFQSMSGYRSALLRTIDGYPGEVTRHAATHERPARSE